jgi:hypothetical protein
MFIQPSRVTHLPRRCTASASASIQLSWWLSDPLVDVPNARAFNLHCSRHHVIAAKAAQVDPWTDASVPFYRVHLTSDD